jgi:hypothetical protein
VGTHGITFTLTSDDFKNVTLWDEKEIEMQSKNDKIVKLIKAYLDGKTLQPTAHKPNGCYSDMDGGLRSVITTVIAHPDSFSIKPETKKVRTRTWITIHGGFILWDSTEEELQSDIEARWYFKQWLDPEPRVYEVEV